MSPHPHLCQNIIRTSGCIDFATQVRFQEELATPGYISRSLSTWLSVPEMEGQWGEGEVKEGKENVEETCFRALDL